MIKKKVSEAAMNILESKQFCEIFVTFDIKKQLKMLINRGEIH